MKIKLKKFRHPEMISFVRIHPKGGAISWQAVGEVLEIDDAGFAHSLLSDFGDMLCLVEEESKKEKNISIDSSKESKDSKHHPEAKAVFAHSYEKKGK